MALERRQFTRDLRQESSFHVYTHAKNLFPLKTRSVSLQHLDMPVLPKGDISYFSLRQRIKQL